MFKPYFDQVKGLDEPTQLQWVDIHTWMLYDILLKADRMSMANSLELRVPFLDREVLKVATALPARLRSGKEQTKIALRRAAMAQLPESVAKRKKLGFPVPLNDWLRRTSTTTWCGRSSKARFAPSSTRSRVAAGQPQKTAPPSPRP